MQSPVGQCHLVACGRSRPANRHAPLLHPPAVRGYDYAVHVARTRRIWHFEVQALCEALDEAGAWQTAVRIRVAHREALRHRPEGTAFDVRPTPEDGAPLNLALDTLRAQRARASGWSARRLTSPERNREPTNPERPHA